MVEGKQEEYYSHQYESGGAMKKILQIASVDFTVKKLLLPLVNRLLEEGYHVDISCAEGEYTKELEKKGYNFRYINAVRKINVKSNIKTMLQLYRIMKENKYDIVHTHTPVVSVLARVAAKLAGVKCVIYTAHGFYFHDDMSKLKYKFYVTIEKVIGKYFTDYIFTQSYEDYLTALNKRFTTKDRLVCISNGIDIERFSENNVKVNRNEIRQALDIPVNSKVIGFTGRLVKEKGIIDLLEAFKLIITEFNDVFLVIIGDTIAGDRDLETKNKIKMLLEDSLIREKVRCLGLREDIPEILNSVDIFSLPSYREGMPRSIIEAMAMGKPIIATDIRGCREEVTDNYNGFLVGVNSPSEIYESIKVLLTDNNLFQKFSMNSIKRAHELYDERKVLDKQLEIMNMITTEKINVIINNYKGESL